MAVLTGGFNAWSFWWWSSASAALAPLMVLAGIAGIAACWIVKDPRGRFIQGAALIATLVAVVIPQAAVINTRIFYTTDSAAFDQIAGRALLRGRDPYVESMTAAARTLLKVPALFWTDTVAGGHVAHFSYPAGSFLLEVPAMLLGFHHMVVDWNDLIFWMVTVVLLFVLLPASLRWVAALVALIPTLVGGFSSGETDALFLPFLVLAVWRWDRFGQERSTGAARWIGPVALGLACAIKQEPWFCVPFLTVGIYLEAQRRERPALPLAIRYLATVVAVFAAVNMPFAVWQPSAWVHGTFLPLTGGLVADGQGIVTLAIHGVVSGANLTMLTFAAALAWVAGLMAFLLWYAELKRVWMMLVILPFFLAPRSLSSYMVDLVPVVVIAALSVQGVPRVVPTRRLSFLPGGGKRWLGAAVTLPCLGAVALCVLAFSGSPVSLSIKRVATTHSGRMVKDVEVLVHNETDATIDPHFIVNTGDTAVGFWASATHGAVHIAPHGTVLVTLYPPTATDAPQPGAGWVAEAYTVDPSWLSTSKLTPYPLPRTATTALQARSS